MFPGGIIPGWLIPFDQAAAEAIHDYIQSHRIYENVQALCEALIMAVDYGKPVVHAWYDKVAVDLDLNLGETTSLALYSTHFEEGGREKNSVTNLNSFANVSTECSSRHQGESEEV